MDVNLTAATAAYKNTAKMQSGTGSSQTEKTASLTESPHLPGEGPTRFKPNFDALVGEALDNARDAGYRGEGVSAESIANKAEYHELITAVNNADLTLRTVVAVRDRMISAYQDIIKMPI